MQHGQRGGHSGGVRRAQPGRRVLDDEAVRGVHAESFCGQEEGVWRRLAPFHHRGGDHHRRSAQPRRRDPRLVERVGARGDDRDLGAGVDERRQGLLRTGQEGDAVDVGHLEVLDPLEGRLSPGRVEVRQERPDDTEGRHPVEAEEPLGCDRVLGRPGQPGAFDRGDAVDERPVHVEENGPEGALVERQGSWRHTSNLWWFPCHA